jgi:hypothetical protein
MYKIMVNTTDKFGAGTDAKVYIKLYGEQNVTEKIPLVKSLTHDNPFEAGNQDMFEVVAAHLGPLTKIR